MTAPAFLEAQTRPNLEKTLGELGIEDGEILSVTDPSFCDNRIIQLVVRFK